MLKCCSVEEFTVLNIPCSQSTCIMAAQVLAKSCKMIPVMVMGTLIGGKLYTSLEYGCAMLIAAGISLFAKQSSSTVRALPTSLANAQQIALKHS